MRWIFTYNEAIKKHIEKVLKTKIKAEPQPWLHIAVKTVSKRNPWAGFVIYVWDTREVQKGGEYRSKTGKFETSNFTGVPGLRRARDNRQPLKGGKGDVNKFFEFEVDKSAECDDVAGTEEVVVGLIDCNGKVSVRKSTYGGPSVNDTDNELIQAFTTETTATMHQSKVIKAKCFRDKDFKSKDDMRVAIDKYVKSISGTESVSFGPANESMYAYSKQGKLREEFGFIKSKVKNLGDDITESDVKSIRKELEDLMNDIPSKNPTDGPEWARNLQLAVSRYDDKLDDILAKAEKKRSKRK